MNHSQNDSDLRNKILDRWKELKNLSQDINFLISRLETTSNNGIGIFGGAVRDWWLNKTPKDIDIVIDTEYFQDVISCFSSPKDNAFGGYVFEIDGVVFDIWNFQDSYAFKHGGFEPSWTNLVKSVPFNIDSVIVMLNYDVVHKTESFWAGMQTQEIDFVNSNHRDPKFIAKRALNFKQKYGFSLSKNVNDHVNLTLPADERDNVLNLCSTSSSNSSKLPIFDKTDTYFFNS